MKKPEWGKHCWFQNHYSLRRYKYFSYVYLYVYLPIDPVCSGMADLALRHEKLPESIVLEMFFKIIQDNEKWENFVLHILG
jgi:hypothetical protein